MKKSFLSCALCCGVLLLCGCNTAPKAYMAPVDAYCLALQNNDFAQMQLAMPAQVLNSEGIDAGELAEMRTGFVSDLGDIYTLTACEDTAKALSAADCSTLNAFLLSEYNYAATVTEAYLLDVTVWFSGDVTGNLSMSTVVYCSGQTWYLDFNAATLSFSR